MVFDKGEVGRAVGGRFVKNVVDSVENVLADGDRRGRLRLG